MYQESVDPRYQVWDRPQEGYIAGEITEIYGDRVAINDLSGMGWSIDISNANIRRMVNMQEGEKIKIRGSVGDNNTFKALDILPWEGRRNNMQQNHR